MRCLQIDQLLEYARRYSFYYVGVALGFVVVVSTELLLPPRTLGLQFDRDDSTISKTFVAREIVGNRACLVISAGIPLALITAYCTVAKGTLKKKLLPQRPDWVSKELHLLHASALSLLLTLALAGALTCSLKFAIGNPRPDFLARCQLDPATKTKLFSLDQCRQQDQYLLFDGLRSTPSGHSSLATAGLMFLFVWQARFTTGPTVRHYWCCVLAIVVMASRIIDHKHFWYDVLAGGLLGLLSMAVGWRALYADHCQLQRSALAVRAGVTGDQAFQLPPPATFARERQPQL